MRIRTVSLLAAAWLLASPPNRSSGELLPIRQYTAADGLAHDRVKRIREDRLGFVWLCTMEGLSRFDGRSFVNYGVRDGLPVPSVNDVVETPDGFWVATNGGGVAFFRPDATAPPLFRAVAVGPDAASRVNVLLVVGEGTLWAGTDGGLFRCRHARPDGRFEPVPLHLPGHTDGSVQVWALLEETSGILAATGEGLYRVGRDGTTRRIDVGTGAFGRTLELCRAPDGSIVVGTAGGVAFLSPDASRVLRRLTTRDGLPAESVHAVHASGSRVVIGTMSGLAFFENGRVETHTEKNGLPEDTIDDIASDCEGGLWFSTQAGGAMRLAPARLRLYRDADGVAEKVSSVFERRDGSVVALGDGYRLSVFDGERFRSVALRLPPGTGTSVAAFRDVIEDREGDLWVATGSGLLRYAAAARVEDLARSAPKAVYRRADGLATDGIARLHEDRRGDIWIGCFAPEADALTRFLRKTGRFERYGAAHGLPAFGSPSAFGSDAAGNVWISYRGGELVRFRHERFETLSGSHGFPTALANEIRCDASGRLWIATAGGGLVRVDHPDDAEPSAAVYGREDGIDAFYLGAVETGDDGLVHFADSRQIGTLDTRSGKVTLVAPPNGLLGPGVTCSLRDRTGALWLGSWIGLLRFRPGGEPARAAPRVRIGSVSVSGVSRLVPALGVPRLDLGELPDSASVGVAFFGVGLAGQPLRYEHLVEGLGARWTEPYEQPSVQFARLAAGRYGFRVRAVTASGERSAPAELDFTVLPPVWRRWWFLGTTALLLVGAGYAVKSARDRMAREREAVRTRIAADLHDDLGASVARIGILSEVLRRHPRDAEDADTLLRGLADASRGVQEKLADGIWAVDPRKDDLRSLADRLRLVASELLDPLGVAWRVEVPPGSERVPLSPECRRQVYLMLKEGLTNVARHAEARNVTLVLSRFDGCLSFVLSDDGRGFAGEVPGERLAGGRGLFSMRERAAKLGGCLQTVSEPGRGTTLRLNVRDPGHA